MARTFPTNSSIRSEFQYFAIQQKFEKNHRYQRRNFILHNNNVEKLLIKC